MYNVLLIIVFNFNFFNLIVFLLLSTESYLSIIDFYTDGFNFYSVSIVKSNLTF